MNGRITRDGAQGKYSGELPVCSLSQKKPRGPINDDQPCKAEADEAPELTCGRWKRLVDCGRLASQLAMLRPDHCEQDHAKDHIDRGTDQQNGEGGLHVGALAAHSFESRPQFPAGKRLFRQGEISSRFGPHALFGAVRIRVARISQSQLKFRSAEQFSGKSGGEETRSRDEGMPNDAKLGLFTGVIGVIVAAAMSVNRPHPEAQPAVDVTGAPVAAAAPAELEKPPTPVARASEPASTPVIRTRKEPEGTPAGRTAMDDID